MHDDSSLFSVERTTCDSLGAAVSRTVLTQVQHALPLCERPYASLGEACGLSEGEAYCVVESLRSEGIVRRIGASFESSRLGYASTLVALAVASDEIERVAALVGEYAGVTHSYERDNRYNLWFTFIARGVLERDAELKRIVAATGCDDCLVLPARRLFKINVAFDVAETSVGGDLARAAAKPASAYAPLEPSGIVAEELDAADRALVRALQGDLAGTLRPFARAAQVASEYANRTLGETWAIDRTRSLLETGVARRFGARVRHRRMGFAGNAMGVWDVPDDKVLSAGAVLAAPLLVSHCYERPRCVTWPYNLYTMIHGYDRASCQRMASELHFNLGQEGISVRPPRLLYSTREFKKTSMRYFEEDQ